VKLFKRRKRQRTIRLDFHCTACERPFKQRVRRVFIDLNTLEKKKAQSDSPERSEFIIPERIVCPKCRAVDQYEIDVRSRVSLQMTILTGILTRPDPDDPVQPIRFTRSDGTPMHPLDGLEMYAEQVACQPDRTAVRVKYANTLRSLGYMEDAEAQYRAALERDPAAIEALFNLTAFHVQRGETQAAYDCLRRVVECAPRSQHPQRKEFVQSARLVLDGKIRIEDFGGTNPRLHPTGRARPSRPDAGASRSRGRQRGKQRSQ
jgi:tetratricopeptide (TPR) repeat protein